MGKKPRLLSERYFFCSRYIKHESLLSLNIDEVNVIGINLPLINTGSECFF